RSTGKVGEVVHMAGARVVDGVDEIHLLDAGLPSDGPARPEIIHCNISIVHAHFSVVVAIGTAVRALIRDVAKGPPDALVTRRFLKHFYSNVHATVSVVDR